MFGDPRKRPLPKRSRDGEEGHLPWGKGRRGSRVAQTRCVSPLSSRIVVATDFSEASDEAFAKAVAWAQRTGAALDILHVLEPEIGYAPFGVGTASEAPNRLALVSRELERRVEIARRVSVESRPQICEGSPATEIVRCAELTHASLIVVGTHGRTGLARAVLGSVAESVVRHSRCAVLTVPYSKKAPRAIGDRAPKWSTARSSTLPSVGPPRDELGQLDDGDG